MTLKLPTFAFSLFNLLICICCLKCTQRGCAAGSYVESLLCVKTHYICVFQHPPQKKGSTWTKSRMSSSLIPQKVEEAENGCTHTDSPKYANNSPEEPYTRQCKFPLHGASWKQKIQSALIIPCLLPKVGIMLQHQIKLLYGQTKFRDMKAAYSHRTP